MNLSNKEIIKDINFYDNTDRRLGRYDFSFSTVDSEGADMYDYDGFIIEAPTSSRMNDEIEWGQNVPEDWEKAESILLDAFYDWKRNNYKHGGNVHWDSEYRDGGSITSDRRFTEWDFNKLMASDKFEAVWSGYLWNIKEKDRTRILGKFNPKTNSLYISGEKNMNNLLVVWMTENGFVNSNEYAILKNGGAVYAKGGSVKDTDITVGKIFNLINGDIIEIKKLFVENIDEAWVQYTRNGILNENSVKELRLFINRWRNKFANGGGIERIDLFEDYENIPTNIQEILDEYSQDFEDGNYDGLAKALQEVQAEGYTFEYYLDGQAYGLRPIDVPLNELKGYEDMGEEYANGGGVNDYSWVNAEDYIGRGRKYNDLDIDERLEYIKYLVDKYRNNSFEYYVLSQQGKDSQATDLLDSNKILLKNIENLIYEYNKRFSTNATIKSFYSKKYANGGGVGNYEIYHDTLASCLREVENYAQKKGYNIGTYFPTINHVSYGTTHRTTVDLLKDGKIVNTLNIQIYRMDSGRYELNMYASNKMANGGGVEIEDYSDLKFASKQFSKTAEMLVKENLNNGEICMCKLTKILGHEPNYPVQIVGSLKLEKCFMKRFYKIA